MSAVNLYLGRNGALTLPVSLRQKYDLQENDVFTLEDLKNGYILLVPRISRAVRLGDRLAEIMAEDGVSPGDVLKALEKEQERYYRECCDLDGS
jgi:bifunctional DNA-binding transcriptional regulator/antitoxin component of YhaV-PrlF toxin-antitoxin module